MAIYVRAESSAVRLAALGGLLGWTAEELAVIPCGELVHPDDREDLTAAACRAGLGESFAPVSVRILLRASR